MTKTTRETGMLLTGAAGPATNIVLAVLTSGVYRLLAAYNALTPDNPPIPLIVMSLVLFFVTINLILAFFNLIPIPPLDGSRVVQRFLSGRARELYGSIEPYGFMIVILLLFVAPQFLGVDLLTEYLEVTAYRLAFVPDRSRHRLLASREHRVVVTSSKGPLQLTSRKRILTGYRPTGKLHLGHWFGNLQNMLALQEEYDAFYFVADWHAMTTMWADTHEIRRYTEEQVLDWLAAGLDPEKCTIYRQSDVPEVAELALYFTMVTPMSWLERVPSYKEQREQITDKDLGNVGLLPVPAAAGGRHHHRERRPRAGGRGPAAAPRADARDRAPVQQRRTATTSPSPRRSSRRRARASRAPTAARCRSPTATRSSSRTPRTRSASRSCR